MAWAIAGRIISCGHLGICCVWSRFRFYGGKRCGLHQTGPPPNASTRLLKIIVPGLHRLGRDFCCHDPSESYHGHLLRYHRGLPGQADDRRNSPRHFDRLQLQPLHLDICPAEAKPCPQRHLLAIFFQTKDPFIEKNMGNQHLHHPDIWRDLGRILCTIHGRSDWSIWSFCHFLK